MILFFISFNVFPSTDTSWIVPRVPSDLPMAGTIRHPYTPVVHYSLLEIPYLAEPRKWLLATKVLDTSYLLDREVCLRHKNHQDTDFNFV